MVWLPDGEKSLRSSFDTLPACDTQTDGHVATAQFALCITSYSNNSQRWMLPTTCCNVKQGILARTHTEVYTPSQRIAAVIAVLCEFLAFYQPVRRLPSSSRSTRLLFQSIVAIFLIQCAFCTSNIDFHFCRNLQLTMACFRSFRRHVKILLD